MPKPVIDSEGTKRWFNSQGELHNYFGPAVVWSNGDQEWWVHGKQYRLDPPAIPDDTDLYWEI